MADWALQAVIRPNNHHEDHHHHHHHHHHHDQAFGSIDIKKEYDQALLFCYPHLFDQEITNTRVVGGELDQLYKPFYPDFDQNRDIEFPPPLPPASNDLQTIDHHHEFDQQVHQDQDQEKHIKILCGSASNTSQIAPKLKKRKNQQKRVVAQVTADGLSSDPWAWRKYGQKPIKGSIYPRSYYRCSSSKGCMARRQVEQSCRDPSIYILTYTADHNHAQPTRRNSLAGITRNRFKITPKSPTSCKTLPISKDSPFQSPTTPSVSSIEDEVLQQSNIKQEAMFYNKFEDQEHTMMTGFNDDDFMIFRDDFFEDLEDLGGFKMDSSSYNCSNQQFPDVFS